MFSDRVMDNFEEVLQTGLWSAFPNRIQNPYLNIPDIAQLGVQFAANIAANDCANAHPRLNELIKVQLDLGIWNLADKTKSPTRSEIKNIADRLNVQVKRMETAQRTLNDLLDAGEKERKGLNAFTAEKKKELEEIRTMLAEAKQNLDQLANLLADGQKKNTGISEIEDRGKKLTDELNVALGVIKKAYEDYQESSSDLIEQQTAQASESKRVMDEAEKLYKFIKGKEEEIIRLTGMAADGSMGSKFNTRSDEIGTVLFWWRWAVPITIALAIVWVIAIFVCFPSVAFASPWANFSVNLLKTSPAFILMGFVMTQYSKERNLREDYAFKAAVAMTINAYADILQEGDSDKNRSRQKLILAALKQVHTPPKLHSDKGGTLFSWRAKDLRGALHELNESIRGIKDAANP